MQHRDTAMHLCMQCASLFPTCQPVAWVPVVYVCSEGSTLGFNDVLRSCRTAPICPSTALALLTHTPEGVEATVLRACRTPPPPSAGPFTACSLS